MMLIGLDSFSGTAVLSGLGTLSDWGEAVVRSDMEDTDRALLRYQLYFSSPPHWRGTEGSVCDPGEGRSMSSAASTRVDGLQLRADADISFE